MAQAGLPPGGSAAPPSPAGVQAARHPCRKRGRPLRVAGSRAAGGERVARHLRLCDEPDASVSPRVPETAGQGKNGRPLRVAGNLARGQGFRAAHPPAPTCSRRKPGAPYPKGDGPHRAATRPGTGRAAARPFVTPHHREPPFLQSAGRVGTAPGHAVRPEAPRHAMPRRGVTARPFARCPNVEKVEKTVLPTPALTPAACGSRVPAGDPPAHSHARRRSGVAGPRSRARGTRSPFRCPCR